MSWRDAVRLSRVAFTELAFQAIYAFRHGNLAPPGPARATVARARRRVVQSKLVVSVVLGLLAVGAAALLHVAETRSVFVSSSVPVGTFEAGVLTGLFALEVAFLWWTGMQILPTFLSSGTLPVLESLPIAERTLRRATALLYVRLFDLPALTVLILTPLAVGFVLGPLAGLAALPGSVAVVGLSLGLSLVTGRFFLRRVQGSRSGGGRTVLRWGYLVLWLVPAFAMFVLVVAAPAFLDALGAWAAGGPTWPGHLLLAAFPFPFGALPAVAASGPSGFGLDPSGWGFLVAGVAGYLALTVWSGVWLVASVREVGLVPPTTERVGAFAPIVLRRRSPPVAVLAKDLQIASRTPGYAFLILLPVLDAIAIGVLTYVGPRGSAGAFSIALAAITTAALLATFFGPAFFSIEVFAYSYGRTLPLSDRMLVSGKVLLVAAIYLVSGATVLALALPRIFAPTVFAAFIAAELPAVVAAALLELGILFHRARARGLPITNLYASAWVATVVSIPGVIVAGAPLVAYVAVGHGNVFTGLLAMAVLALGELGAAAAYALGGRPT